MQKSRQTIQGYLKVYCSNGQKDFDVVTIDQFSAVLYSNFPIVTENEQNATEKKRCLLFVIIDEIKNQLETKKIYSNINGKQKKCIYKMYITIAQRESII